MKSNLNDRPLIVGEVLFDCFPDHRVLGGAPFNVAWNLRGMGFDPLVITAVGDDEPGAEVRSAMSGWGMDESGLQVLPDFATGRVDITVENGEPSYRFWDDVAFDHIAPPPATVLSGSESSGNRFGLIYHGSLALRGEVSRRTIERLRGEIDCPVFIDINIRRPHFELGWIEPLLQGAEHVKLNLDELNTLGEQTASETSESARSDRQARWEHRRRLANGLRDRYGIGNLWLTAGEDGAAWIGGDNQFESVTASRVEPMVDSVGAGDAFAAIICRGILRQLPPQESLLAASRFAARVCRLRGATTTDPHFYALQDLT